MDFDSLILSLTDLIDQCRAAEQSATITYSRACQLEKAAKLHYYNVTHTPIHYTDTSEIKAARNELFRITNLRYKTHCTILKLRECRDCLDKAIDAVTAGNEV